MNSKSARFIIDEKNVKSHQVFFGTPPDTKLFSKYSVQGYFTNNMPILFL